MIYRQTGSKVDEVKRFIVNVDMKLYSSSKFIRILKPKKMRRASHVAGREEKCIHNFDRRKPREKRGFVKPRLACEDNIKTYLKGIR